MRQETQRLRFFDALFGFAILAGVANFGYHALQGDHGVFAVIAIKAEERALRAELQRVSAERAELENRTQRLSEAFLDLDLLDETARAQLGLMRPDEATLR
ncbi:MAG: FtsB family cell division protein [Rubrimonas sp.]